MSWYTIEPDAGLFSALIQRLQVRGVQVLELHSSLPGYLKLVRPIYGLILLSEWHFRERDNSLVIKDPIQNVFFSRQVNKNACATDAILSILLNSQKLNIGPELSMLKDLTKDLSPIQKGQAFNDYAAIRTAHNSFARTEEQKAYNYVSYLLVDGVLYELDGQKEGPISHGPCPGGPKDEHWLKMVHLIIKEQTERYSNNGIRFHLMAVVKTSIELYQAKLKALEASIDDLLLLDRHPSFLAQERTRKKKKLEYRMIHVEMKLKLADIRFEKWRMANTLLKHDYIPFAVNLLKLLAENNQLRPLIERARQRKSQ